MKQLPKAEEILKKSMSQEYIKGETRFDYLDDEELIMIKKAMEIYAKQVLDYVAENATLNFDEAGRMRVDKESILKIKNELL